MTIISSFLKHQVDTGVNEGLLNFYPNRVSAGKWCVGRKVSDMLRTFCTLPRSKGSVDIYI